jgi:DNA-binding IclR family transcriptional regulator
MKEIEILEFVTECQNEGYTPSLREIGKQMELSPSTVSSILERMTRQAMIHPRFGRSRYIRIR